MGDLSELLDVTRLLPLLLSTDPVPLFLLLLMTELTNSLTDVPLRVASFPTEPGNHGSAPVTASLSRKTAKSSPQLIFVLPRTYQDTRSSSTTTWLTVTPSVTLVDLYPMYTSNSPRPRVSSPTLLPHHPLLSSVLLSRLLHSLFLLRRQVESLLMVLLEDLSLMYRSMLLTSVPLFASVPPTRLTVSTTGLLKETKHSFYFSK